MAAWIGIVVAGLAWVISFELQYVMVPFACQSRQLWILHLVPLAAIALAGIALLSAYRAWVIAGVETPRFMGMFAILFSCLMLVLITAQWIPVFFVDPCVH